MNLWGLEWKKEPDCWFAAEACLYLWEHLNGKWQVSLGTVEHSRDCPSMELALQDLLGLPLCVSGHLYYPITLEPHPICYLAQDPLLPKLSRREGWTAYDRNPLDHAEEYQYPECQTPEEALGSFLQAWREHCDTWYRQYLGLAALYRDLQRKRTP